LASRELASFSADDSLSIDFSVYGVNKDFLNKGSLEDLGHDVLSFLDILRESLSLGDHGDVLFLDQSSVLLVDNGLMMFMNVLFINDGLVVLMDNVLVMFMNNIFLVFHEDVLVMFMDDVLMDFLHDGCVGELLSDSHFFGAQNFFTFIEGFNDSLFVVGHNDGCFVDLLDDGFSNELLVLELLLVAEGLVGLVEVLSLEKLSGLD
jgi:hypothetical protein